jgi:hypothetical protein
MPFWKKDAAQPPPPASDVPAAPRPLRGTLACSEYACSRHDAVTCAYVDRRGRLCPTAWCGDHQVVIEGRAFCRRHARLYASAATGEFQMGQALPDLDNRSPSLADYVGDALEPRVLELLWGLCRPGTNDQVAAEPLHVVHPSTGGARRWDRSWKMYDHTGVIVQVAVEVDESRDPEVDVKVGRNLVGRGIPPWIERRRRGIAPLSPAADAAEREGFYASIWAGAPPRVIVEVEQSRNVLGYPGR